MWPLLLLLLGTVFASPAIIFPEDIIEATTIITLTEEEKYDLKIDECAKQDQMPYWDEGQEAYVCYSLLEKGPCEEEGQWLVLDFVAGIPYALCKANPCNNTELVPLESLDGDCETTFSQGPCGPGMRILPNPMGIGKCDCDEGFLPFFVETGNKTFLECHQEFLQGPCQEGQQFILPSDEVIEEDEDEDEIIRPACVPTDCDKDQVRFQDTCISVVPCEEDSQVVFFDKDTSSSKCKDKNDLGLRQGLFNTPVTCKRNEIKTVRNRCVAADSDSADKPKRQTYGINKNLAAFLNRQRNIRNRRG